MRRSLAAGSLLLLGLSAALLATLTVFESALVGLSPGAERALTLLLLVAPALGGAALGALSLMRREGRTWLAIAGMILNALFALFHLAIVLFAG